MNVHTQKYNTLLDEGYSKDDAVELANNMIVNKILRDEDEEYLKEQESNNDDEEIDEIDGYTDDTIDDFEYDEDEEDELSFEDGFQFLDGNGNEEY